MTDTYMQPTGIVLQSTLYLLSAYGVLAPLQFDM
ncbi:hypothetical protein C7382_10818 [Porphyromonas loveana]|uniref:Uncharacterized protein n=1 Tax=Porphyromonas loveana TaxID=1884669 RepID=A0A2U1FCX9_9PORP|nr:hypothetical protein C7382_10818 [Porphyromonas loveana]